MKCSNCGTPAEPGDRFCANCGHPIAAEVPPAPKPEADDSTTIARPAPAPNVVVVSMPDWVAGDWAPAGVLALSAFIAGLLIQLVVGGLFLLFIQLLVDAPVSWNDTLRTPVDMFISFHGPIDGLGLWATGVFWIFFGFRLASRVPGVDGPASQGSPARRLAFVAKTALLYIIPVTVLAAVLDPTGRPAIDDPFGTLPFFFSWSVAATFFLGLIAAIGATIWALSKRTEQTLWSFAGGGRFDPPRLLRAAGSGAMSTARVALIWLLVLLVLGTFLEALSEDSPTSELFVFLISLLVAAVLWAGLDIAMIFFVFASRFFAGGAFGSSDMPGWMWIGTAIVGLAFVFGGMKAARSAQPRTAAEAVGAGFLVGPLVGLIMFVLSWFVIGIGEELTAPALGLPILWSVASAIGGLVHANRVGLVSGVSVEFRTTSNQPPTSEPGE